MEVITSVLCGVLRLVALVSVFAVLVGLSLTAYLIMQAIALVFVWFH